MTDQGKAVIMISSEMPELIGMSDRILVMADGRLKGEIGRGDFTQEHILKWHRTWIKCGGNSK